MRTLDAMKPETQERIARETLDIYAPLANRLGIQWIKSELEDLSFKYLRPQDYADLTARIAAVAREKERFVQEVVEIIQRKLERVRAEGRGRLRAREAPLLDLAEDAGARRRVRPDPRRRRVPRHRRRAWPSATRRSASSTRCGSRCPGASRTTSRSRSRTCTSRSTRPWSGRRASASRSRSGPPRCTGSPRRASPRTGRTRRRGATGRAARRSRRRTRSRSAGCASSSSSRRSVADPREFLETVKVDLFSDEVFVFTPKGAVKSLPRGATPVDFAYTIHSEIGEHTVGAKVNGKLVPLRYKLKNGDTVEILTSPHAHPSKDWLTFVKTSRAQARIRQFIRQAEHRRSIEIGRERRRARVPPLRRDAQQGRQGRHARQGGERARLPHRATTCSPGSATARSRPQRRAPADRPGGEARRAAPRGRRPDLAAHRDLPQGGAAAGDGRRPDQRHRGRARPLRPVLQPGARATPSSGSSRAAAASPSTPPPATRCSGSTPTGAWTSPGT